MTHEYDDPFNPEAIDAAVAKTLELRSSSPDSPLDAHVEAAVHQCFCSCALDIEDRVEQGRSGLHEAIAVEVRRRVEHLLSSSDAQERDRVDEASKESFPASDPPAWIWQRSGQ